MAGNITIDKLAGIIKGEFDNVGRRFDKVNNRFNKIDADIKEVKADIKGLHEDHENLELKMSNVAYRFEVDDLKNQLNLLRQRVDGLEKK